MASSHISLRRLPPRLEISRDPAWSRFKSFLAGALGAACLAYGVGGGPSIVWASAGPSRHLGPVTPMTSEAAPDPENEADKKKERDKEYKVKAALLFKFLEYATFPKAAFKKKSTRIEILIVGDDPFGPILDKTLAKKKLKGRGFRIVRSRTVPKNIDAHLVFAAGLSDKNKAKLVAATKDKPCILVGEESGFAKDGAFINFYKAKGKIRFEINTDRQRSTKVSLKAELLKLAKKVESPTEGKGK